MITHATTRICDRFPIGATRFLRRRLRRRPLALHSAARRSRPDLDSPYCGGPNGGSLRGVGRGGDAVTPELAASATPAPTRPPATRPVILTPFAATPTTAPASGGNTNDATDEAAGRDTRRPDPRPRPTRRPRRPARLPSGRIPTSSRDRCAIVRATAPAPTSSGKSPMLPAIRWQACDCDWSISTATPSKRRRSRARMTSSLRLPDLGSPAQLHADGARRQRRRGQRRGADRPRAGRRCSGHLSLGRLETALR